ncbi:TPA: hypothetical protein EYO12_04530 [Candidatus Saccharibacteria bacterium]|nr:hypothetical protein [Candidatus Saccharibacteria bacterium]HIO87699.1 hypothetical protein [Candidatus Saccharibacteria bacterium]
MEFAGQFDDEEVLFFFRQHPVVLRRPLLAFLLIFTVTLSPLSFDPFNKIYQYIAGAGFIISVLIFFYYWVSWYYSFYIVTNIRIIQDLQKGLFGKQLVEVDLSKIQNINYEIAGFQASLFRFGTIVIQTFVGDLVIEKVHEPAKIQKRISSILREYGGRPGDYVDEINA